jgi:hypothetical protein
MKTKRMLSALAIVAYLATSAIMFTSCEEDEPLKPKGEVTFDFSVATNDNLKSTLDGDDAPLADAVLVTIKDNSGETVYENEEIKLYNMNGSFISEPISLVEGSHKLTKFMVLDAEDNVIYASPLAGSPYAYLVGQPLAIDFNIQQDEVTKLAPEVLSTEESTPESFGYATFGFDITETFDFMMTRIRKISL